jgi:hypothetical protein
MSKVAQYAIDDNKVYARFSKVNLKEAQDLHCKRPLLRQKKSIRGDKNERVLYCCRFAYQDVEKSNEDDIYFSSHPILETLEYQKFHLLQMTTSYLFIF